MITFNVGPSQLAPELKNDLEEAWDSGVMQISHRSSEFTEISKRAIEGLRDFYNIPADYKIFYASSATEAMRLALLNACQKKSQHFVCGSFSRLFADISISFGKQVVIDEVAWGRKNNILQAEIDEDADFLALTQTETSTGVAVSLTEITKFRQKYPEKILAVDITSSAGGIALDIKQADIWFFSVQKCFGLPAGLAFMVVSPRAYEKSLANTHSKETFSWPNMWKKMEGKYQTVCTPNVLNIFLFAKKIERLNQVGGQTVIDRLTKERLAKFNQALAEIKSIKFFASEPDERAQTVFCLEADANYLAKIKKSALEAGIILGGGYGQLKDRTFRLANFPNLTQADWEKVLEILLKNV